MPDVILNDDENQPDSKQIDHLAANLKEKHQELMATTSQASQKGDGKTMKNHEIFDEKTTKSFFGKNLARAFGRPCANPTPELPTECIYSTYRMLLKYNPEKIQRILKKMPKKFQIIWRIENR